MINLSLEAKEIEITIPSNSVASQSHKLGMKNDEPLILILDNFLKYAKAYKVRYEESLCSDHYLGAEWLAAMKSFRNLMNGDGAVAMTKKITTDSKDNHFMEDLFWIALEVAGFTKDDFEK